MSLSREEILRYSRHLIMPEVGLSGQEKLKASSVLIVGAGGLGSPAALYLAAAGVGRIGIVDFDAVDLTNLQRQILHGTRDVGTSKLESARSKLADLNPSVEIICHDQLLTSQNALDTIRGYGVVIDGTDNFPTRYLVNDACILLKKPCAYGSIFRFDGQTTVFGVPGGPCYRCLFPEPPPPGTVPSCAEGGVLGILPGVIGVLQATEAVKLILGIGESLVGRLVLYDALSMSFREVKIRRDPRCPVCGDNPIITEPIDYLSFCGVSQIGSSSAFFDAQISPLELSELRKSGEPLILLDVREPHEYEINRISGSNLMPLRDLPARIHELNSTEDIVIYCLMGSRSAEACQFLRNAGFARVRNLKGGIRAWINEIEPELPNY